MTPEQIYQFVENAKSLLQSVHNDPEWQKIVSNDEPTTGSNLADAIHYADEVLESLSNLYPSSGIVFKTDNTEMIFLPYNSESEDD